MSPLPTVPWECWFAFCWYRGIHQERVEIEGSKILEDLLCVFSWLCDLVLSCIISFILNSVLTAFSIKKALFFRWVDWDSDITKGHTICNGKAGVKPCLTLVRLCAFTIFNHSVLFSWTIFLSFGTNYAFVTENPLYSLDSIANENSRFTVGREIMHPPVFF